MVQISAREVKALRDATGAGMMDAKRALIEAAGDPAEAAELLKQKGLAKAAARADREAAEGAIAVAVGDGVASLVHLRSETDFSAKAADFLACTQEIAEAVRDGGTEAAGVFADRIDELRLSKKENISLGAVVQVRAAEGHRLDAYLHRQDGRGVNGVIVEGEGVDAEVLHQVALHVAFAKPRYLDRGEVPDADVERERASLLEITKAEGRPEAAWDKIVQGRLTGWFRESVLLEQGLHGDKTPVSRSIGSGRIVRFEQAYLG
ncbi:MAG: translation elongation factor Ts [bacterium]|nr:translation elongation factor Ts [bacterium]MXV91251.1 translation elongation factor Ts [Acidimicrobiia bacterium]MYC45325.1 translation elongation factor Ts [Acidimicrobiia bacterium]MYI20737.1 translation elongation factor Ts [Acidimicrobiia bacterium]